MKENVADFDIQQDDVFGRIANRYDVLCDLFRLGIHRLWKRRVTQVIAKVVAVHTPRKPEATATRQRQQSSQKEPDGSPLQIMESDSHHTA